jgi:beta-glucosidase
MWVNAELNASDAFVAVWLPGSEGLAVADVLFSNKNGDVNYDFTGKLSYSWPANANQTKVNRFDVNYQPLLPYGFGLKYGDANVLVDDLAVGVESASTKLQSLTLFESSIKAPWKMMISDSNSSSVMTSSIIENKAVYLRTIDRNVQEDARRVIFNGKEKGQVTFTSSIATDLTQYVKANSILELTVRLTESPSLIDKQGIYLSMLCGDDCQGKVNISKELSLLTVNQWHSLNIDLQCFVKGSADMKDIISPFALSSSAALSIDFSDVFIKTNSVDSVNVSCK